MKEHKLAEIIGAGLESEDKALTRLDDVKNRIGEEIFVRGWVYRKRHLNDVNFVLVRDGFGIIQSTIRKNEVDKSSWDYSEEVYIESVVKLIGTVIEDERAPEGVEIKVREFKTEFKGDPFPISKDQSTEMLLDIRHLSVRKQGIMNALKLKAQLVRSCREFLDNREFIEIQPPMLNVSACEGGSTLFEVKYFDKIAYLSQSGQLYSEAVVAAYPLVYVMAPSFRAEPSRTPRHMTEFWQLEPEMAFYNQNMNMKLQEEMIEYVCHELAKKQKSILERFKRDPKDLLAIKAPFDRITYTKAIDMLKEKGIEIKWGDGIGLDEEKILTKELSQPVFLTNQPKVLRAFYMKENPEDPRTVLDADMLAPEGIGEIIGGSERISDYNELILRMKAQNLNQKDYEWYLDIHKYGQVPHSGFGMGTERVIRWMAKLETIRDAIPFPRTMNRLYP
ncbi:TPA: asparagine--tRNA ligase [Candidatus Micrarchaeota archaeon]|nr:asparagine--tRNA ligase [Candidatus Micrarchaeota archaeon]HII09736.1 asparagine--tRNA ligase [Candidatus Micrarchaeota archaeon]